MTAFGSRGAATILHKLTVWGFIGFIFTTLAIGVLQGRSGQSTVMSDVPAVEEAAPAETPTGVPATTTVVDDEAATAAEGEVATPADDGAATVEGEDAAGSPAAVEDDSTASSGEAGES